MEKTESERFHVLPPSAGGGTRTRSRFPKHGGYLPVGSGKLEIIEFTGWVQAPSHTQKDKPSDDGTPELVRLQLLFSGFWCI